MLFAQQNNYHRNPPQNVQRSWQRDYPNYNTNNSWEYRNNRWHNRYQDRDHNNRNVDVYYDRNGRRVFWQSEWDRNDLPVVVRDRIRTRYHADNYNAYRIERPGGGFYFQITIGGNRNIYLDERGREVRHRW
jgi:hypothetical protein